MQAESFAIQAHIENTNEHQRAVITLALVLSSTRPVQYANRVQNERSYEQTLATLPQAAQQYVLALQEVQA